MAYHNKNSNDAPRKDLEKPIMGNSKRMEDGVHTVTIRDVTKTETANGLSTVTLELADGKGNSHTSRLFLYRQRSTELSGLFKKLLSAAFWDDVDTLKEVMELLELHDWLVLDYLMEKEITIRLKSSAGYRVSKGAKGYTTSGTDFYATVREARDAANAKGLTPSYTNIIDISIVGEDDERTDKSRDTTEDTKTTLHTAVRASRSPVVGDGRVNEVPTRRRFFRASDRLRD
jgi:hypothetical protein